eukprot:Em0003g1014a
MTQQYFWPGITKDVKEWVECCDVCQRTKQKFDHPAAELHPVPEPSQSWKQIGIDIVGPLPCTEHGNKYIIVVTDYFTKWPEAKASPTKEAGNVAEFLFDLFLRHGCPDIALSDQGREFYNKESYRTKAAKNISCAQARQKRQYDLKHNTSSRILKVGDEVLKENSKHKSRKGGKPENPWTGPFYIHEGLGKGRYKLKTESGEILKQTIHCARLKLYRDPIEVEADDDHSKQDVVGDQNVCNEVKCGCAKAAASKQEVIEGSGEDEKLCMKNECIVAVNSSSGKDSEETASHQAIWDKPESTASHATTYHRQNAENDLHQRHEENSRKWGMA